MVADVSLLYTEDKVVVQERSDGKLVEICDYDQYWLVKFMTNSRDTISQEMIYKYQTKAYLVQFVRDFMSGTDVEDLISYDDIIEEQFQMTNNPNYKPDVNIMRFLFSMVLDNG